MTDPAAARPRSDAGGGVERTRDRPRGIAPRTLLALVAVAVTVFVAVGVFGWWRFLRYERVAARHVPVGAAVGIRLDVEKIVFFDPVRKHLLPLVDEGLPPGAVPRLRRVEDRTGVIVGRELRELAYFSDAAGARHAGVACGRFGGASLVAELAEILEADGAGWARDGDLLRAPGDVLLIAQALDGCLVLASDEAWLRATVNGGGDLRLPADAAGGFAATGATAAALARRWWGDAGPLAPATHVRGAVHLRDPVIVETEVAVAGDPEPVRRGLEELLAGARRATAGRPDIAGENAALAAAVVRLAPGAAVVSAPWRQADVARGFRELGETLRATWSTRPR